MVEIELNGQAYRIGTLNAMTQFHVSRRLAPMIPSVLPLLASVRDGAYTRAMEGDAADLAKSAEPLAQALSQMSDDNANFIIKTCLSVVRRKQDDGWRPVQNQEGALMFDDIDLVTMMQLAFRVIRESLGGFMQGLAISATTASPD